MLLLLHRRYREEVFTQELPLIKGMEIARELSLNMETRITMEPRREGEEKGNKLHSCP